MRALLLFAVLAAGALAQPAPSDAWLSMSFGAALGQEAGPQNDFYISLSAQAASPPWVARLSYAELDRLRFDLSGALSFVRTDDAVPDAPYEFAPDHYQTLALGVGRLHLGDRLAALGTAGPSVTWGEDSSRADDGFVRPGLSASGQAAVRLAGPLWVGVEAQATVNRGASHSGAGLVLRVDLARPAR